MRADPAILIPIPPDNAKLDRQVYLNAIRRSGSVPLVSLPKEEASRAALLEYAAFVLEQEDCYCQM